MIYQQPKFIDLFAGIGGFRLAFEQAGYQCVYSCEINEACQKVYFNNFGEVPEDDVTQINTEEIPNFDVLTAGFPCQPFSICGRREGFQDTRGSLFFYICKVVEAKKPAVVVLENVKHLIHLEKGRTLDTIIYSLEKLGYLVDYKLLNAKDFGVPQNRERIIIIATQIKKFDFDLIRTISPVPNLKEFLDKKGDFEYLTPQEYTMIDNPKKQASGLIFVGYRNKGIWKKGVRPNTQHLSRVHRQPNRIYSIEGVHPTLPSQESSGRFFIYLPKEDAVRKLTIEECYRIMGFPHDFTIHSNLSECYKQIGNSVCIPMIYELAVQLKTQKLIDDLESNLQKSKIFDVCPENIQLEIFNINKMNHRDKLTRIYETSINIDDIQNAIPETYQSFITEVSQNCFKQKGVYTVLITLLVHKIINPEQDIRYHQSNMNGGFSGRTIDTQYITPTLKELGLPAMAESGWLTRSLEQPYPYTLDYNGKINNKKVKEAFLQLVDFIQKKPQKAETVLKLLLYQVRKIAQANQVKIIKISNTEKFDINIIIDYLQEHFHFNYKTRGASKLPVIAFYAIYQRLIEEVERYKFCRLKELGSHTASDRTSKSAGDIEIIDKNKKIIEVLEIKHGKKIDFQMLLIAKEKIIRFKPRRYYIFSSADLKESDRTKINREIEEIKNNYGCQVIVNGILPTLKYYLRLIMSLEDFVRGYSSLIASDNELQLIHKTKWNEILSKRN
ncbi:MAG: DNA cytosine methyltransferase [Spirulinaceae cyanobacterium]